MDAGIVLPPPGRVSIVAGEFRPPAWPAADGLGSAARFLSRVGLQLTESGDLYVIDAESWSLRRIAPDGVVTTVAGTTMLSGDQMGRPGRACSAIQQTS